MDRQLQKFHQKQESMTLRNGFAMALRAMGKCRSVVASNIIRCALKIYDVAFAT
jgi:hypothetical protein